jgi:hypothetical protein
MEVVELIIWSWKGGGSLLEPTAGLAGLQAAIYVRPGRKACSGKLASPLSGYLEFEG